MSEAFDRSPSGRRNRALFYDVDRIVYVEGGRDDKGAMESFDGLFWKSLLAAVRPELRVRIVPKGGKNNLLALAGLMEGSVGENVIIAMDRDYDSLFDRVINATYIVYTRGYSFENDIFCSSVLEDLFMSICPICDDIISISETIKQLIDEYCRDIWWAQFADVCGGIVARKVIDRNHVQKYITSHGYGNRPNISKSALAIDVYKANSDEFRDRVNQVPLKKEHLPHFSIGHLYANFCYRIITYLHQLYSNTTKLTRDAVMSSGIANLAACVRAKPQSNLAVYYREALAGC